MFDEQFPEDDEHAECRHEIHTLKAELERVKAANYELQAIATPHMKQVEWQDCQSRKDFVTIKELRSEIESLKSRLPVNADGDVIQFRSIQYGMRNGNMRAITVMRIDAFGDNEFLMLDENDFDFEAHELFSTAESCRAANAQAD